MKWETLKVGLHNEKWKDIPDGVALNWSDTYGLNVVIYCNNPSKEIISEMSEERGVELAFKDINNIGFFAFKFGKLSWSDCPFSPNHSQPTPKINEMIAGKNDLLNIMLVDTAIGELRILRAVSLSPAFFKYFRDWCAKSLENNITERYYERVINEVFKEYQKPEFIAESADFKFTATHREDEPKREELQKE